MIQRIHNTLHRGREERGAGTLVWFIIIIPLIAALFAIVVDYNYALHARDIGQSNAQVSLTSAVSQLGTNSPKISTSKARKVAIQQYTTNRDGNTNHFRCATARDLRGSETLQGGTCKWILRGFSRSSDGSTITIKIKEMKPRTMSGGFFPKNKKDFTVHIEASSMTRFSR